MAKKLLVSIVMLVAIMAQAQERFELGLGAGNTHEAGGEAHAFGGIGNGAVALKNAGIKAAWAVEIIRGFLNQRHAFPEHFLELLGGGELGEEVNGSHVTGRTLHA